MADMSDQFTGLEAHSAELKAELAKHREDQQTKRHEAVWSAVKAIGVAFVGTAAVGIATAWINKDIRETELALEAEKNEHELALEREKFLAEDRAAQRTLEQDYLQKFLRDALSEDLQRRVDFAQYVASVTLNKDMRELWKAYHGVVEKDLTDSRQDLRDKLAELDNQMEHEGAQNQQIIASLRGEIKNLKDRISGGSIEIASKPKFYLKRSGNTIAVDFYWFGDIAQCRFEFSESQESVFVSSCSPPSSLSIIKDIVITRDGDQFKFRGKFVEYLFELADNQVFVIQPEPSAFSDIQQQAIQGDLRSLD